MSTAEKILLSGLFISVASLAWSPFGTSVGMGFIALSWCIALCTRQLTTPTNQFLLGSMLGLFAWHVAGLVWTENIPEGLATLKIKLPLFIVPLSLLTVKWNSKIWLERILQAFVLSLFFAAIAGLLHGFYQTQSGVSLQPHQWSPFISHIRMGILLALGWGGVLVYREDQHRFKLLVYALVAGVYIWQTQSVTGAVMLILTSVLSFHKRWRLTVATLCLASVCVFLWILTPGPPLANLPTHTEWGSPYTHHLDKVLEENGNKVWCYLAWDEMRPEWNLKSKMDFDSKDLKGQDVKYTLMRYLTSMGVPKDGLSVKNLSLEDVIAIEAGNTSINQEISSGLALRLDELKFEAGNFIDGGNPSGNSVTQRWEYFKVGLYIAKTNLLVGVGTGDLPDAFNSAYKQLETRLSPQFRHRTHNQFLAWLISGGVLALFLFIATFFFSWNKYNSTKLRKLGRIAWWVTAISCLSEDTFETQAGITFAVLAIVLFSLYDKRAQSFSSGKRWPAG